MYFCMYVCNYVCMCVCDKECLENGAAQPLYIRVRGCGILFVASVTAGHFTERTRQRLIPGVIAEAGEVRSENVAALPPNSLSSGSLLWWFRCLFQIVCPVVLI